MNQPCYRLLALLLAVGLLTACVSTPRSNHYLLTAGTDTIPTGDSPSLGIGPVEVPPYLNRDPLVYRLSHNQLQISSEERWAEPLESGITRVLVLNLAAQLNTRNVQAFPYHAKRRPALGVKLRVIRLDAEADAARLVAEWLLYRPTTGEAVERRLTSMQTEIDPQQALAPQVPVAYSTLMWELAEEIAAQIRELPDAS